MSDVVAAEEFRERCYRCFRPVVQCFCDCIPALNNQTRIRILQHKREQFHAFNTARIVHAALTNSRLHVGYPPELMQRPDGLSEPCGVLYPGEDATLLSDIPVEDRPAEMILPDGTWHHTKTMMRDIPWLRALPKYSLRPDSPSTYRIRREPSVESLSCVEAIVDVLRILEPNLSGLDELLVAFNEMIDRHIAVTGTTSPRFKERRADPNRIATNIPAAIKGDPRKIIVAYGESTPNQRDRGSRLRRGSGQPVYWVAQRLQPRDGRQHFAQLIQPNHEVGEDVLTHMNLSLSDFANALSPAEFRAAWREFVQPDDQLVVYSHGTGKLLANIEAAFCSVTLLKTIDYVHFQKSGTLADLVKSLGVAPEFAVNARRAERRLAAACAIVNHLRGER